MTEYKQQSELNFKNIYKKIRSHFTEDAIVLEALSQSWLTCDKSLPIEMQAAYMYTATYGRCLNEVKHRQKHICSSVINEAPLTSSGTSFKKDEPLFDQLILDAQEHYGRPPTIIDSNGDTDLILEVLQNAPDDLQKPLLLILNSVFDNYFIKPMTPELIRQRLKNTNYYGNCSLTARRIYDYLVKVLEPRLPDNYI